MFGVINFLSLLQDFGLKMLPYLERGCEQATPVMIKKELGPVENSGRSTMRFKVVAWDQLQG